MQYVLHVFSGLPRHDLSDLRNQQRIKQAIRVAHLNRLQIPSWIMITTDELLTPVIANLDYYTLKMCSMSPEPEPADTNHLNMQNKVLSTKDRLRT